jgi:hypothetical protein
MIIVAMVVGRKSLGMRRKADFATLARAPSMLPALDWRMGFRAQT